MPARDVERYIDAAVASVLSQSHNAVELLVVDDSSEDATADRIRWWAARDRRVRPIFNRTAEGPNVCRNVGIEAASGRYLAFVDADDILLDGAYRDLVAALDSSASDFVVGCYDRLTGRNRTPAAPWIGAAHSTTLRGVTIAEHPSIMVNVVQWSKLYRRAFWQDAQLTFPARGFYQDQIVAAEAYVAATAIDVIERPVVSWRVRDDGTSMTQQFLTATNIADRFRTLAASVEIYRAHEARLGAIRLQQALSNDVPIVAESASHLSDEAARSFRSGLRVLASLSADPQRLPEAPSSWRTRYLNALA